MDNSKLLYKIVMQIGRIRDPYHIHHRCSSRGIITFREPRSWVDRCVLFVFVLFVCAFVQFFRARGSALPSPGSPSVLPAPIMSYP